MHLLSAKMIEYISTISHLLFQVTMLMKILIKLLREGLGRLIILIDLITRPRKMKRAPEAQQAVNAAAKNLTLYQFYACPFCVKTRRAIHQLNLPIEFRDAQKNPTHRSDLETLGGAIKVPCLRIQEDGKETWMYESGDIIQYLQGRFA